MIAVTPPPLTLDAALGYSTFAARLVAARPAWREEFFAGSAEPFPLAEIDDCALREYPDAGSLDARLRELRARVLLRLIARDLTGRADLTEVCTTVTRLADAAVHAATRHHHNALRAIHGVPIGEDTGSEQHLVVVAMGKHGGGELNVSSDIDLIYVYPENGETAGPRRVNNQEFFDRVGRQVAQSLSAPTADGFVFRVDLRLRPYGESGPTTVSLSMLENYFFTQGRAWERYAWLKARAITDADPAPLAALVEPFVYRKYHDYDAYASLREIHRQIREQGGRRDHARNIKLGPGGIREIEFITQVFQLIRGGRDTVLRERQTLAALARLAERQALPLPVVEALAQSYRFLRNLEHRLQYQDDQQTQTLPPEAAWPGLALTMGFPTAEGFADRLAEVRRTVQEHFDGVFGNHAGDEEGGSEFSRAWRDPETSLEPALAALELADPAALAARLEQVRSGSRYRQLPSGSRDRFDALLPRVLQASRAAERPAQTVTRMVALLEAVSRRSAYLALMIEHPPVLPRVAQIVGASAWAADYLTQHPILLDELINATALLSEPDWADWRRELDERLDAQSGDAERQLDAFRHFQQIQTFRLLAQDLYGRLTVERLADHLSALADTILAAALRRCWQAMPTRHRDEPRFAIVAYGKLGGKELGYASDLDLVFLHDDPDERAQERYARLSQRLITWLTSTTSAGALYATDLRLRPDGESGLLVSSLEAFRRYQREHAWLWEHQALTRARFVAGDANIGAAFESEREAVLRLPREKARVFAEITDMRRRMHDGHLNRTALFDLKHDRGGMVDVEFAVQALVLLWSGEYPALTKNLGNIALLGIAEDAGLLAAGVGRGAADAYRDYRRLQHQVRLAGAAEARVAPEAQAARRAAVDRLWSEVFGGPWRQ